MAASYPSTVKTFTTKTNKVDLVDCAHINDIQNEVTAEQTELGTNVAGSCVDLKTRLAVSMSDAGGVVGGTSFPASPVARQLFHRTDTEIPYIRNAANTAWLALGENQFAPGDILEQISAAEVSTVSTSPVQFKEISVAKSGSVRVKFSMHGVGSYHAYGRIYKNGTAVGTLQDTDSTSYVEFSEDISVSAGDLIQLYLNAESGSFAAKAKDFKITVSAPTTSIVIM
ncbi:MAG: hypothetical protein WC369_02145 [Dehalococcoidales bacterium]|jgi:hypothetical protein